ncbi:MAG: VRR-NUC domain-containing protein [Mucilaginibacter sp.]
MSSKFKSKVKIEYEKNGYKVISLIRLSESGITDLMCLKDGNALFIECKEAGDTLKPLQKYKIDQLIKDGFIAFCLKDGHGQIYPPPL